MNERLERDVQKEPLRELIVRLERVEGVLSSEGRPIQEQKGKGEYILEKSLYSLSSGCVSGAGVIIPIWGGGGEGGGKRGEYLGSSLATQPPP